jgi:uncharacterized protein YfaT (DUF1175 family)
VLHAVRDEEDTLTRSHLISGRGLFASALTGKDHSHGLLRDICNEIAEEHVPHWVSSHGLVVELKCSMNAAEARSYRELTVARRCRRMLKCATVKNCGSSDNYMATLNSVKYYWRPVLAIGATSKDMYQFFSF